MSIVRNRVLLLKAFYTSIVLLTLEVWGETVDSFHVGLQRVSGWPIIHHSSLAPGTNCPRFGYSGHTYMVGVDTAPSSVWR